MNNNNDFREGFIFYKGYYESCIYLPEDERLIYLQSLIEIGLYDSNSDTKEQKLIDFENNFNKICEKCKEIPYVLAILMSNKANLKKTYEKYLNGCKGGEYGKLGGAPIGNKNACKNNPKTTPKEKENENENITLNITENNNVIEDSFIIPSDTTITCHFGIYDNVVITNKHFANLKNTIKKRFISYDKNFTDCIAEKIINELSSNIERGKAPIFCEDNINEHFNILCKYLGQKCKPEIIERFINEMKEEYNLSSLALKKY